MRLTAPRLLVTLALLAATSARAEDSVVQMADLDTQVGLDSSFTRWTLNSEYEGEKGGMVVKSTALALTPIYRLRSLGLTFGLPVSSTVHKTGSLRKAPPEDTTTVTSIRPELAWHFEPITLAIGYESILERGEWEGANDQMLDYSLSARRTHVGAALAVGGGKVGVGYSNRVSVMEEFTHSVSTTNSSSMSSAEQTLDRYPRTTVYARFPVSAGLAAGGAVDYTALTDDERDDFRGRNRRGVEDALGARATLWSELTDSLSLETSLKYHGPERLDFEAGTGLTHAYGAAARLAIRPAEQLRVAGALEYMAGRNSQAFDSDVYDEDTGDIVGSESKRQTFNSTRAVYGISAAYLF